MIAWPLTILKFALYPAIYVTQKFTNQLTKGRKAFAITEDEILAMVKLGARDGEISDQESEMVRNIIHLEDRKVREIMTPRTKMFALAENLALIEAADQVEGKGHSRIPIYKEEIDHITGYVLLQEILSKGAIQQSDSPLQEIANKVDFVPDSINCLSLLTKFLKNRLQISIVTDEYGGVAGLVTLEDLIETALGTEIVDETDREVG
jgi:CBS domain containing-hemolysin-like protein